MADHRRSTLAQAIARHEDASGSAPLHVDLKRIARSALTGGMLVTLGRTILVQTPMTAVGIAALAAQAIATVGCYMGAQEWLRGGRPMSVRLDEAAATWREVRANVTTAWREIPALASATWRDARTGVAATWQGVPAAVGVVSAAVLSAHGGMGATLKQAPGHVANSLRSAPANAASTWRNARASTGTSAAATWREVQQIPAKATRSARNVLREARASAMGREIRGKALRATIHSLALAGAARGLLLVIPATWTMARPLIDAGVVIVISAYASLVSHESGVAA